MQLYDNIDDAKAKLDGTMAYYKGKAVFINHVTFDNDAQMICSLKQLGIKNPFVAKLDDPELNYTRYNLGYANGNYCSVWWQRVPLKQYKQGLSKAQVTPKASNNVFYDYAEFSYSSAFVSMLENSYPDIEECSAKLKAQEIAAHAFHRDFGFTWDPLHKDLILEYRGTKIGIMPKLGTFDLADDYQYLKEALKEAIN